MEGQKYSFAKDEEHKDDELIQTLEQHVNWNGTPIVKYEGFWIQTRVLKPVISVQKHFKAKHSDIILPTMPKSGTTWLKALTFCIAKRNVYTIDRSPLLTSLSHNIVPFLEIDLYFDQENPDLEHIASPRFFSTHIPFHVLPDSIRDSKCKLIYICRNPLDQFISFWHFLLENRLKDVEPLNIHEAFDMFCKGISFYGPFWDHALGYWNAHLNDPQKVLFLKYEDLKENVEFSIKTIAEFIGLPFTSEEEEQGKIHEISTFCSIESLRNLDVNKNGIYAGSAKHSSYFRKGEVGDWTNYLTSTMAQQMIKLTESKLQGSGLVFKYNKSTVKDR